MVGCLGGVAVVVVGCGWWVRWVAGRVGGGVVVRLQKCTPPTPKIGIQVSQETRLVCVGVGSRGEGRRGGAKL